MAGVRELVRKPVRMVRRRFAMGAEFARDYRAYRATAAPTDDAASAELSGIHLETQVTKDYHRVEKGLSLRSPKHPFGDAVDRRLAMLVPAGAAIDEGYQAFAVDAREALAGWNTAGSLSDIVSPMAAPSDAIDPELLEQFFATRHSVRDFDEHRPVDPRLIDEAVRLAGCTPSVCNRQAARVHVFEGAEDSARILAHQNGNAGFRHHVRMVMIVTVERGLFAGAGERNQRWVDGGLFAMTLVWALHGLGLSSCMLNWSMTNARTDALRQEAGIPASEDVICLIAVGHAPAEGYRVARSPKRPLSQVLTRH